MFAYLPIGTAKSHRGNPAAALSVEVLYAAPKMYSGLATLILSKSEVAAISHHQKLTLQRLQRLYPRTPSSAVHFLSGVLPAQGLLDLKKFSLLGMIARLGSQNTLFKIAVYSLHYEVKGSWFCLLRETARQYSLPDPLQVLCNPPEKKPWKNSVKEMVCAFWHKKLCLEVHSLPSLSYLKPEFIPLSGKAHPLWTSCESSSSAVRAATVQGRLVSGRYRHDKLRSHFGDGDGSCRLCGVFPGDTRHILSGACIVLKPHLETTLLNCLSFLAAFPALYGAVTLALNSDENEWVSFILDPSTNVNVIPLAQDGGEKAIWPLFRLSRAYIWSMHKTRLTLLGLEKYLVN